MLLVPTLRRGNAFSGVLRPVIFIFPVDARQISFTKPVDPMEIGDSLSLLPRKMDGWFGEVWQNGFGGDLRSPADGFNSGLSVASIPEQVR